MQLFNYAMQFKSAYVMQSGFSFCVGFEYESATQDIQVDICLIQWASTKWQYKKPVRFEFNRTNDFWRRQQMACEVFLLCFKILFILPMQLYG